MTNPDAAFRYLADLVGGLADAGCTAAFVSPGSRNTPLTLALGAEPRITDVSVRDERSAGFAALGHGKATGTPAIVACTSGSAATHYLAAVVEADQSAAPLIVLTADRPVRLRGTGAPQTMDQTDLYGAHVKTFVELDPSTRGDGRADALALDAAAVTTPAGPVHANVPLEEPLVPPRPVPPAAPDPLEPRTTAPAAPSDALAALEGRRVLVVVGGRGTPRLAAAVTHAAEHLGAPVFADPQANVVGDAVLSHGDLIVGVGEPGSPTVMETHRPDVVVRIGPIPTSKPMWQWLEASGVDQILIDSSRLADPLGSASVTVDGDPAAVLEATSIPYNPDRSFLTGWLGLDAAAGRAVTATLETLPFPNEPQIARSVAASVPDGTTLFVASSMPVRDLDAFGEPRAGVRVLANRGLNGIDGTISTALGVALSGAPTTLLVGDLAALHDATALGEVARLGAPLRIVVVNNDGGGIFSFLPQASSPVVDPGLYERHWGTPHGLRLAPIAAAMGLEASTVSEQDELEAVVAAPITRPGLVELVTDRDTNLEHHRVLRGAVAAALGLGGGEQVEEGS